VPCIEGTLKRDETTQSPASLQPGRSWPGSATQVPIRPSQSPVPTATVPGGRVDLVHFLVQSRPQVSAGEAFLVRLWAYLKRQQAKVAEQVRAAAARTGIELESQGPIRVARGTELVAHLELEDMVVNSPVGVILWEGEVGKLSFPVRVPEKVAVGDRQGMIRLSAGGATFCELHFVICIGQSTNTDVDLVARL